MDITVKNYNCNWLLKAHIIINLGPYPDRKHCSQMFDENSIGKYWNNNIIDVIISLNNRSFFASYIFVKSEIRVSCKKTNMKPNV
jgi:hypothetical protein